ncbi:MAG: PIG-L family deacetylase [Ruminococcaceae bacterium]|nr:PIG-L family deacetylase [Oscillospiraceae bacterium]
MSICYYSIDEKKVSENIDDVFPNFGKDEVIAVMSPHDDDAVIGAGYAMLAAKKAGAEVYVVIFCRGDAGYSTVKEKETIEKVREKETLDCYERMGISADHILRMNFKDFSAFGNIGWEKADGKAGDMPKILRFLREKKVTRVMVPNHHREHIDHTAAHIMGSFNAPQAGDSALVDYGTPHAVRSVLEYSVWADLAPDDALVNGRPANLRANRIIEVSGDIEAEISNAVSAYVSQAEIIKGLIEARRERRTERGTYIEVYLTLDCRPKIDFTPYKEFIEGMKKSRADSSSAVAP